MTTHLQRHDREEIPLTAISYDTGAPSLTPDDATAERGLPSPPPHLPMDPEDPKYVFSFSVDEVSCEADSSLSSPASKFLQEWGFIVLRDVFSPADCAQTREAMWSIIEDTNKGFSRHDPLTWDEFKAAGKYGLSSRGPSFHPTLVNNRQNERLIRAIATLLQVPTNDVMVSHDRFTIYRSTILRDEEHGDGARFRTGLGQKNIHLDLNPWWWLDGNEQVIDGANTLTYTDPQDYIKENNMVVRTMGPHFQCVLNFADNLDEDGGTLIVPQFHHRVKEWTSTNIKIKKPMPFISFGKDGVTQEAALLEESRRVTMREGSVLIWNQTMMHGTCPNYSSRHRLAQFMKVFSRSQTYGAGSDEHVVQSYKRLHRRSVELDALMRKSGARDLVSDAIGKFVFGFDILDAGES